MVNVDILDYLGRYGDLVIVSLTIGYADKFYNSVFCYKDETFALTVDDDMESDIGCEIEDWELYEQTVKLILDKVVPYPDIVNIIDDFDYEGFMGTQSNPD